MFGNIFKKKSEPEEQKVTEKPKVIEEPKPEVTEKPQATEKPSKKPKRTSKPAMAAEEIQQKHVDLQAQEKPFVGIKEYSSVIQIAEKIDKEIAAAKSALGDYLRQLDDVRAVAEKSQRLHDVVAKATGKKQTIENAEQIEVNGLEIVLDATPLHELTAMESVVRSYQQRLITLQKANEALKTLDQVGDTEGISYLVLERDGIPEQILLKLS